MSKIKHLLFVIQDLGWCIKHKRVGITWTDKDFRFLGWREDWYDGPIYTLGLWFFHFYAG